MVEDIITALSRFKSLFVIARNSIFTYKGKAVDMKQVGRELGVRYVLEGQRPQGRGSGAHHRSADRRGHRRSSLGRPVRPRPRGHLRAAGQVTASVVGAIEPKLERGRDRRAMRKPPESLDAWEAYQRGFGAVNKYVAEGKSDRAELLSPRHRTRSEICPGTTVCGWPCNGRFGTTGSRPFSRCRACREKPTLPCRSTIRTQWRMPYWRI